MRTRTNHGYNMNINENIYSQLAPPRRPTQLEDLREARRPENVLPVLKLVDALDRDRRGCREPRSALAGSATIPLAGSKNDTQIVEKIWSRAKVNTSATREFSRRRSGRPARAAALRNS